MPTIVCWPSVTQQGSVCSQPIMSIDWYPTLLEVAKSQGNATHNANVDGRSIVPMLRNADAQIDRSLFWHYPHYHAGGDSPYSAVRSGDWRLIQFHEDNKLELYNLKTDIGEKRNLAASEPAITARLQRALSQWRTSVKAQMPTQNPQL